MALSKRLQRIVNQIQGSCLADIGCDHGYVVIEALKQNKVKKAYACDVAPLPLENAQRNIEAAHLQNRAQCLLMNGIESLPKDVDCIVMAGMGGSLMIDILERGKVRVGTRFYLSCHKDTPLLRKYLLQHGFSIEKEWIIQEDRHFYPLIQCVYTRKPCLKVSEKELYYGVSLEFDKDAGSYLENEKKKWTKIFQQMPPSKRKEAQIRLQYINELLDRF